MKKINESPPPLAVSFVLTITINSFGKMLALQPGQLVSWSVGQLESSFNVCSIKVDKVTS
jgi:hypothetical protein